jgi:hypothetical protein
VLRRITLRNSPNCETDNPFFKVIPLLGRTFFLNEVLEVVEAQIFPNKLFGIGYSLTDNVGLTEGFRLFSNADSFVALTDQLGLSDQQYVLKYLKTLTVALSDGLDINEFLSYQSANRYTIVLRDRVESPTDEFDSVKTQKTITVTLRDGINLSD